VTFFPEERREQFQGMRVTARATRTVFARPAEDDEPA
jgi:hypothetical protein